MAFLKLHKPVSLTQLTNTFVPFGLLIILALMAAELSQNLVLFRAVYSVWVTMLFLTVAICLYVLPGNSQQKHNYWLLTWTFSFLAYLVHFYYTVVAIFGGSIAAVYAEQGPVVATSNFLVTAWWGLDVLLGWISDPPAKWIQIQRGIAHFFIPFTFFVSAVLLKTGTVHNFGLIMTGLIGISLLLRIRSWFHPTPTFMSKQANV